MKLNTDPGLAQEKSRLLKDEGRKKVEEKEGEKEEEEYEDVEGEDDTDSTGVTLQTQDSVKSQVCKLKP